MVELQPDKPIDIIVKLPNAKKGCFVSITDKLLPYIHHVIKSITIEY